MSEEQTENIPTPQHVLITAEQVAEKVDELGKQISQDYSKEAPLLVGVLKGLKISFDFPAVLVKTLIPFSVSMLFPNIPVVIVFGLS